MYCDLTSCETFKTAFKINDIKKHYEKEPVQFLLLVCA